MAFEDRTLACKDCGAEYVFSSGEQEFFKERGLVHDPVRCPSCRGARRRTRAGFEGGVRQMYPVVCASCGKDTEVPFEPRLGTPVYCSDCFASIRSQ